MRCPWAKAERGCCRGMSGRVSSAKYVSAGGKEKGKFKIHRRGTLDLSPNPLWMDVITSWFLAEGDLCAGIIARYSIPRKRRAVRKLVIFRLGNNKLYKRD